MLDFLYLKTRVASDNPMAALKRKMKKIKFYLRKQILAFIFASTYLRIMKTRRDVYQAIADPTRREIISLIAEKQYNVNAIAEKFDMSRQAVSLHLKILADCGLLVIKQSGRDRFCEAKLDQLDEVVSWVAQSRKHWVQRFEKLDQYLTEIKTKEHGK